MAEGSFQKGDHGIRSLGIEDGASSQRAWSIQPSLGFSVWCPEQGEVAKDTVNSISCHLPDHPYKPCSIQKWSPQKTSYSLKQQRWTQGLGPWTDGQARCLGEEPSW